MSFIQIVIVLVSLTGFAPLAIAKKNCTDQPKSKWMSEEAFKAKVIAEGYEITKFKQPGSCYEIYGLDPMKKEVEIYFNPVDGTVTKRNITKKTDRK